MSDAGDGEEESEREGDEIAGGPASDAELEAALLVELRAPPRRT